MKRSVTTLSDIKQAILLLKGEQVKLSINRGRRKILKFEGVIDNVYSSVFTVKAKLASTLIHTYSYSDILCGEVKITKLAE
ncbi:MAG: Veg family protein [Clostridia bacterium]|nr:Veg family protein [Clostridia bacterium]